MLGLLRSLLLLCTIQLGFGNLSGQNISKASKALSTMEVSVHRSGCYGECPSYNLKVLSSGRIVYKGLSSVPNLGSHSFKLLPKDVEPLFREVYRQGFFTLRGSYANVRDGCTSLSSDSPSIYITVIHGSKKGTVRHYLGCEFGNSRMNHELARLSKIESSIDRLVVKLIGPLPDK